MKQPSGYLSVLTTLKVTQLCQASIAGLEDLLTDFDQATYLIEHDLVTKHLHPEILKKD